MSRKLKGFPEVKDTRVLTTIVGGEIVFERGG